LFDPDVDRLAFICEDEKNILVACADYVLSKTQGTRYLICLLLRDVTNRNNGSYEASAVGEVNVVDLMKEQRHYRKETE
jgi:phosphomannomutase